MIIFRGVHMAALLFFYRHIMYSSVGLIIIIIIIIKGQLIGRRNMSMKSLQGRRTAYTARIKLKSRVVHNTTVETNES